MFSKNTTRVFRRRRRKRRSASHRGDRRERRDFRTKTRKALLSTSSSKRAGRGKKFDSTDIMRIGKQNEKRRSFFRFRCSRRQRERVVVVFKTRKERERERKKSIIVIGCVPPKKTPTTPCSSSREDAWEKHVCLSRVCSLSIVCRRQKSVANFDDVFSLLCAKDAPKSTPLNPFLLLCLGF